MFCYSFSLLGTLVLLCIVDFVFFVFLTAEEFFGVVVVNFFHFLFQLEVADGGGKGNNCDDCQPDYCSMDLHNPYSIAQF